MAKGIYVGGTQQTIQGNRFPTTWTTVTTGTEYVAADGTRLTATGYNNTTSPHPATYACDDDTSTAWISETEGLERWIMMAFTESVKITKMKVRIASTSNSGNFEKGIIQGRKTNGEWKNLYTHSVGMTEVTEVILTNTDFYNDYRILVTVTKDTSDAWVYMWQTTEYITSSKAKKVTKAYIGASNLARKVIKGYIGVDGVAKQFFEAPSSISYYKALSNLSDTKYRGGATTVGNYAIFAGGDGTSSTNNLIVDYYTSSLVKGTAPELSKQRKQVGAVTIGDYALFAGGESGSSTTNTVETYSSSLTKGTATELSAYVYELATTTIGNYALIGGGYHSTESYRGKVDTYTSTLVKGTATNLSTARFYLGATTVGKYALFGGGTTVSGSPNGISAVVDTYTSTLTKGTATGLSVARAWVKATSVGDYALFGGGETGGTSNTNVKYATVDTYTSSLVKGTATDFSETKVNSAATTVGNYALFGGGYNTVEAYDKNLLHSLPGNLSVSRNYLAATSIGKYALFGGGYSSNGTRYATVNAYKITY